MLPRCSLIVNENEAPSSRVGLHESFIVEEIAWDTDQQTKDCLYQQLIYKVLRKPKQLMFHLQRIYFTFNNAMSDQLYAALVDLLWILRGKGELLSLRMVSATASVLSAQQSERLCNYLKEYDDSVLLGNQFSLFTTGIIGCRRVLTEFDKLDTKHDPLVIARDYIEYSQLEQAMETLQNAILEAPERLELQVELIALYRITKSYLSYITMTNKFQERQMIMSNEWRDAAEYFAELNNEE